MSAVLGMGVNKCAYNSILQPILFDAESAGSDLKPKVVDSSQQEVFMKTLVFFCALMQNGCLFNPEIGVGSEDESDDGDEDDSPESPLIFYEALSDIQSRKPGDVRKCNRKLVFKVDEFGRSFIQCENHQKGHRAHLIIHSLNEFDLEYLCALCTDELEKIMHIEESARREGYGPLVACNFVSSTKEQKELCEELFMTLLDSLGWRLADATPRKIILDSAFRTALQKVLNWDRLLDPSLNDLHPSLRNFDHTARLINKLHFERFPNGTGFEGWDTIIADEHCGQALGLGLYLQDICKDMAGYCSMNWTKPLHTLTPYDHAKLCLHICLQHYTTHVHNLKTHVTSPIYRAMISLYSADPIPDYKGTIALIEVGGKKASDWLKDKLSAENSLLAAIYHPLSKIPVEVWKASLNTTNGNEQSHHNIYHDGRKMSLVPGAMCGFQYDSHSMVTLKLFDEHGIQPRDRLPTYYLRASRALVKTSAVQKHTVKAHDNELRKAYNQYSKLHDQQLIQTNTLKCAYTLGKDTEPAVKGLQTTEQQTEGLRASLSSLQDQSSGTVPILPLLTLQNSHSVNSMHTISVMTTDHSVNSTASDIEGLQYAGTHHLTPTARNSNLECYLLRCGFDEENTSIDPQTSASSVNDAEDAGENAEDGDSTADRPFGLLELEKLFTAALLVNPFMAPHHKIGSQWEKVLSDLRAEGFCKNRDVKTICNKVNTSIDKIEQKKVFGSHLALGRLVSNDTVVKERLNSHLDQLATLCCDAKNTKEKNKAAATKVANKAHSNGSKMCDVIEGITKGPKCQADDEESSDKENSSDSFTNVRSCKKPWQDDMELRELLHRMEEQSAESCVVGKALVEAHKEVGKVGQALIDEISKS
ncbi:hypothetical protein M422DRAFT_271718 [Sphaerobolus stellatus SS14]|uniref:Uncharacterized protein n=1 Tax=Sphaerobolus stellatus (strain SS14) TaxID=990650 RepID=A0A0C9UPA3_SPHS4|nr:hypothetical protein M422DRAFT_271718 [Sphaerobolus stellatus SS14]